MINFTLQMASTGSSSLINAMKLLHNPRQTCEKINEIMNRLLKHIHKLKDDPKSEGNGTVSMLHVTNGMYAVISYIFNIYEIIDF